MIMTCRRIKKRLYLWGQINAVHICFLFETLDSALRRTNPLNFRDKIAQVYAEKRGVKSFIYYNLQFIVGKTGNQWISCFISLCMTYVRCCQFVNIRYKMQHT